jgi:hypothetical protein
LSKFHCGLLFFRLFHIRLRVRDAIGGVAGV